MENPIEPQIVEVQEEKKKSPAEKMYENHLKNVRKYQKKNPEKMREKSKKYVEKLKEEKPDAYREMLLKKKEYYQNVRRPMLIHLRQLKQIEQQITDYDATKIDE